MTLSYKKDNLTSRVRATLSRAGQVVAFRRLDFAGGDVPFLAKGLGFLALAEHPELAGQRWRLHVEVDADNQRLRLSAHADSADSRLLAQNLIPVQNLAWIGSGMARQIGVESADLSEYRFHVRVLDGEHAADAEEPFPGDDDFQLVSSPSDELTLPNDFSTKPLGPLLTIRDLPHGRIRCVFHEDTWDEFRCLAAAETEVERGFIAAMRVHLLDGVCNLVLKGPPVELPAVESGSSWLLTTGRRLLDGHRRFAGKFAYLHLHPRSIDGVDVGPHPSGPDVTVAWNISASTPLPACLPIALRGDGSRSQTLPAEVAAHAFVDGLLQEIPLDVGGVS